MTTIRRIQDELRTGTRRIQEELRTGAGGFLPRLGYRAKLAGVEITISAFVIADLADDPIFVASVATAITTAIDALGVGWDDVIVHEVTLDALASRLITERL